MSFTVESISEKAANYGSLFPNTPPIQLKKFVLNDVFDAPLPKYVMKNFNSMIWAIGLEKFIEEIRDLPVYEDDIWVVTYPKCGTTWTQEAVWQICNNLDFDYTRKITLGERFPFIE